MRRFCIGGDGWQETESEGTLAGLGPRCWQEIESEGCVSAWYKVLHGRHCLARVRAKDDTELERCVLAWR